MIYLVVLLSISGLLIYGSWKDWHHAKVSNKITFAAITLSLLTLVFVGDLFWRGFFILLYYMMFKHHMIGGADMKILIACLISTPNIFLFLSAFLIYTLIISVQMRVTGRNKHFAKISNGTTKILDERIPGFVPITMSYIITTILTLAASYIII